MKRFLFSFFLFFLCVMAHAQTLTGKVVDAQGCGLKDVSVSLLDSCGNVVVAASSSADGVYRVTVPTGKTADKIKFTMIGLSEYVTSVDNIKPNQTITMTERNIELDDVTVKANKIIARGDTLIYSVAGFRQKHDRSIEDVIKHMPGIKVLDDGSIQYNGRKIEKFYVEGEELVGDKYGIISKNLSAYKVKSVEVLRNHQKKKALRKIVFSNEVSLNIVLEKDAKNKFEGALEVGTGSDVQGKPSWLRNGKLVGMYFSDNMQTISMYKCDNSGQDIYSEVGSMSSGGSGFAYSPIGSFDAILNGSRSQFNDTHVAATNWLFKLGKDDKLHFQLSQMTDKSTTERYSETSFMNIADGNTLTEGITKDEHANLWEFEMMHSVNSSKLYLTNLLQGLMDFGQTKAQTVLNGQSGSQFAKPYRRGLKHLFLINIPFNENYIGATSNIVYTFMPGSSSLYNGDTQFVKMKSLKWDTDVNYSHRFLLFRMTYSLGTNFESQNIFVANTDTVGYQQYNEFKWYFTPSIAYRNKKFDINLSTQLYSLYKSLDAEHTLDFYFSPQLRINYSLTPAWRLSSNWMRYSFLGNNLNGVSTLMIYGSYNIGRKGTGIVDRMVSDHVSVSANFSDYTKMLYCRLMFNVISSERMLYNSTLVDGIYKIAETDIKRRSNTYNVRGSIDKKLDWKKLSLGFSVHHSWTNSSMLVDGAILPNCNSSSDITVDYGMQLCSLLTFDGTTSFRYSCHRGDAMGRSRDISNLNSKLKVIFNVGSIFVTWSNELNSCSDKDVATKVFSDLSAIHRGKYYELGLLLNNIWGYNRDVRHVVGTETETYSVSLLRPRELLFKFAMNF